MGHDSENLLREPDLAAFRGAILSPVNYTEEESAQQVHATQEIPRFDTVFDPQLYYPRTDRECLREWSYFPADVDTADLSSMEWWGRLNNSLLECASRFSPSSICSPTIVPRAYSNEYFGDQVDIADLLITAAPAGLSVIQSAVVGMNDLAVPSRALAIASILSRTRSKRIYLVFLGATEPRRELTDLDALKGAMQLIFALNAAGFRVMVGFTSSDVVLWKFAGAADCASGKFFNLRRFTPARFEEPAGGGGQLPYWIEEDLMAFLRESDLIRTRSAGILSDSSSRNPFGRQIMRLLDIAEGSAWVAKSWRQYLWWFADIEARLSDDPSTVSGLLKSAEEHWNEIEDAVLMEERTNDGRWIRVWRRACLEFRAFV